MLIQFRVENHRSLRDEQVVSFAAAAIGDPEDSRLVHTPALADALLPAIAIYGANASGKTNVLNAMATMRDAVVHSYRLWEPEGGVPNEPFALSKKRDEPSLYEVEIVVDGVRFRYGFVVSKARVEEEWLFAWPNGHKQSWFEREGDDFSFGRNLHGDNEAIKGLTRSNSLFLSAAVQNNHLALVPVFRWFSTIDVGRRVRASNLGAVASLIGEVFSRQLSLFGEDENAADRQSILEMLSAADTGITDMKIDSADPHGFAQSRLQRRRGQLFFRHKSEEPDEESWLPVEVESAGTIALLELAPTITHALRTGGLVCIDEMEGSLHPMLALALLRLFQDSRRNPKGAQLLFTTHDTNLLGSVLGTPPLRRDQIWFTEKDGAGSTHLYPLTDFHPRKQENLERGYLQGRYGAIPFLGELLDDSNPPTDEAAQ